MEMRLRNLASTYPASAETLREAADEMEKLRKRAADIKKAREIKKTAANLTLVVVRTVQELDFEMKSPADEHRGRRIAAICNRLELQNDLARLVLGTLRKASRPRPSTPPAVYTKEGEQ